MAFSVQINDEHRLSIKDNDRGQWEQLETTTGLMAFFGYGGEVTVNIFFTVMQDGSCSIHIVHWAVDSPVEYSHVELPADPEDRFGYDHVMKSVNATLATMLGE